MPCIVWSLSVAPLFILSIPSSIPVYKGGIMSVPTKQPASLLPFFPPSYRFSSHIYLYRYLLISKEFRTLQTVMGLPTERDRDRA